MRQRVPIAQEEFITLEQKSACKRLLLDYKSRKTILKSISQARMSPDCPIWDTLFVSTVDLWTFIVDTSYGGTVTIFAIGKDGFVVNKDQFRNLDTAIPIRICSMMEPNGGVESNIRICCANLHS